MDEKNTLTYKLRSAKIAFLFSDLCNGTVRHRVRMGT